MSAKMEPRTVWVEIRVNGVWVAIEEQLTLDQHEANARKLGATEIRTSDRRIHRILNSKTGK